MVIRSDLIDAIRNIPWFIDLTPAQVDRLAAIADFHHAAEGELIFREGDRENFMYVILQGQVGLEGFIPTQGNQYMYTADPLDILGWSSMTPVVRQRTATGRALAAVNLLRIDSEALRRMCEEDHDLGYLIMKRLANVVASQYLVNRLGLYDLIIKMGQDQSVTAAEHAEK